MTGTFLYLSLIGPSVSLSDGLKSNSVIANIYENTLTNPKLLHLKQNNRPENPLIKHLVDFVEKNDVDYIHETIEVLESLADVPTLKDEKWKSLANSSLTSTEQ